jgi:hypothetical protein
MIRTQSIISVSEAAAVAKSASAVDGPGGDRPIRKDSRRRKSLKAKAGDMGGSSPSTRAQRERGNGGHESGSTIPEESDGGRPNTRRDQRRSPSTAAAEDLVLRRLQEALRPLEDQQRQANERLSKLHHSLEVLMYQQRERDSNSNINRDMVLLVKTDHARINCP